jgi:DNA-binding beta-propeller fold protein YncE
MSTRLPAQNQYGIVLLQNRRSFVKASLAAFSSSLVIGGCVPADPWSVAATPELVWGRRGLSEGRVLKPRAIAIDANDELYLVDTTGRIQVFDGEGNFLRGWKMPETEFGRPTGLSIDSDGHLLVADTHYHRMLAFTSTGVPVPEKTIGGVAGKEPGEFAFVTDAVRDPDGLFYIGEYGDSDRIQRFSPEGEFVDAWGGTGREPGLFVRPQSLVLTPEGNQLWVADACNHRIQVFDVSSTPKLIACWGVEGSEPGQLYYPYDLILHPDGTILVCEYGNQRIQRFTQEGQSLGILGRPGHGNGEFYQPWGLVLDSQKRLFVLDSNNHRVQRFSNI